MEVSRGIRIGKRFLWTGGYVRLFVSSVEKGDIGRSGRLLLVLSELPSRWMQPPVELSRW